jgi:hypothetical protein
VVAIHEEVQERLSLRTVVVRYPDGDRQYWLTEEAFSIGDELRRNGQTWVVDDVLGPRRSGGYTTVTLRDRDAVAESS